MSVWASESSRDAQDTNGNKIKGMVEVYGDTTTDSNGEFQVDLTPFDLVEVLDATAVIVGQTLDAADNITDKLTTMVVEVSNTLVRGAAVKPTETNVAALGTTVDSVVRGGAGNNVKVKVTGRR